MKKAIAILTALFMALTLFACSAGTSDSSGVSYVVTDTTPPASGAAASSEMTKNGYYDPAVDYTKNNNYKVGYLILNSGILYDMFSKAFQAWADRMNVTYDVFCADKDKEYYMSTCQSYCELGYDGLLLDPDSTMYPRLSEMLAEYNIPWMGCMAPAYADDGTLLHPYVGFDNVQAGVAMAAYNTEYAKKTWPDAKPNEIGAVFIGWSTSPVLAQREEGYKKTFIEAYPDSEKNYFFCDGSIGDMTSQTSYNLVTPVLSANPDIKYWLISGFFDDYTDGAAGAAAAVSKADNTVCSTFGGSGLIKKWDTGENSCWKAAIYTDQRLYAMPIFCGLYAMMNGENTAEKLWPEWVNNSKGDKYATVQLPTEVITQDTYREYMMWVANYTGIHQTDYDVKPGSYTATVEVPASYNAPPEAQPSASPDAQPSASAPAAPDAQASASAPAAPDTQASASESPSAAQ